MSLSARESSLLCKMAESEYQGGDKIAGYGIWHTYIVETHSEKAAFKSLLAAGLVGFRKQRTNSEGFDESVCWLTQAGADFYEAEKAAEKAAAAKEAAALTRHDVPAAHTDFVKAALSIGVLDMADLIALSVNHGGDFKAFRAQVMNFAFSNRHHEAGRLKHAMLCQFNDAASKE